MKGVEPTQAFIPESGIGSVVDQGPAVNLNEEPRVQAPDVPESGNGRVSDHSPSVHLNEAVSVNASDVPESGNGRVADPSPPVDLDGAASASGTEPVVPITCDTLLAASQHSRRIGSCPAIFNSDQVILSNFVRIVRTGSNNCLRL